MALLSPEFVNRPSTLLETPQIRRRKPTSHNPHHRPAPRRRRATGHPRASGDGWHRVMAAEQIDAMDITAELRDGGRVDALKHALGANAIHGQRRSNADKRRCVELAIKEFASLSSRAIAELCGVSKTFVENIRPDASATVANATRTTSDGRQYPATRRTSKPATPEEEEAAAQTRRLLHGHLAAPSSPGDAPAASPRPRPRDCPATAAPLRPPYGGLRPPLCRRGRHCWGRAASPAHGHRARSVGSPPPNSLRPLPASVSRGPRLPGVAGRGSPPRASHRLPADADEQPPGFPPPTTLRSAPPFSFPPLDSSFPRFAAPVPKRPGVIPP